jgi:adenosine deaminase
MTSSLRYAELHLHLEGCLSADILAEIAPDLDRAEIEARLAYRDFRGFIESFKFAVFQLNEVDHYRLLARRVFENLHRAGVVYAEIIHSSGVCLLRKQNAAAIAAALLEESARAPLTVRWIFDAVRQLGGDHALATARVAADFGPAAGVVAFGVGGDETGCPAVDLKPAFDLAREAGMRLTPHAGETSNAQNVWDVLALGADRIGHGIRAIEDPRLVAELAARQVPLEISITSNVRTGAVASYEAHPARKLHEAGVPILLNSDDPAFFDTTLAAEFAHAGRLGFSAGDLEQLRLNAFRFAFGPTPNP